MTGNDSGGKPRLSTLEDIVRVIDHWRAQPRSEANKSECYQALREAEAFLENEILAAIPTHTEGLVHHAKIASMVEDWHSAIIRWSTVRRIIPQLSDRAFLNISIAYRRLGSPTRAQAALRRIKPGALAQKPLETEQKKIATLETSLAAKIVGTQGVLSLGNAITTEGALDLIRSAMVLSGWSPSRQRAVSQLAARISQIQEHAAPESHRKSRQRSHIDARGTNLFLAGFGWSGTGAVHDCFVQAGNVIDPANGAELAMFGGTWGAGFLSRVVTENPARLKRALTNFLLGPVLGLRIPDNVMPDLGLRRTWAVHLSDDQDFEEAMGACHGLIDDLDASANEPRASGESLSVAFQTFFGRVLSTGAAAGKVRLFSNCITAEKPELIRLVPGGRLVVVVRDPRDQYVAQMYEYSGRDNVTVDGFIAKVSKRYRRFHGLLDRYPEVAQRTEVIRFEHFVLSESFREELAARLGVDLASITPVDGAYTPEQSRKNVGIHATYPAKDEIARIREALPGYVFDDR